MSLLQKAGKGQAILDTFYEIKPELLPQSSLALGFFDGVHPGHRVVIESAVEEARRLGTVPAVVTFKEHPRALTLGKSPQLLTLIDQRLELFEQLGIKAALVLSFTEELCLLTPEEYVRLVLVECLGARSLSVGFNHRFGRNRVGDPELLRQLGKKFNYAVHVAGEVVVEDAPVSSSRIRDAVTQGKLEEAHRLLGRPFAISGAVAHGEGRGHLIGFPTANISIAGDQVKPAIGVYTTVVRLPDNTRLPSVVNIGRRPTFSDCDEITTEVHVLDYGGDLYGKQLQLEFLRYLRPERKFSGASELQTQIACDVEESRAYFAAHPEGLTHRHKLRAEQH